MQSSKNQLNAFNKIMLNQFKENWLNVAMLVIIITVTGILAGALMAETFRRITQSILNKSTIDFGHSLLFLAAIILTNFICSILNKTQNFNLIRKALPKTIRGTLLPTGKTRIISASK